MSTLAKRRFLSFDAERAKESLPAFAGAAVGAVAAGAMTSMMPVPAGILGLGLLFKGVHDENAMTTAMGAVMVAGVASKTASTLRQPEGKSFDLEVAKANAMERGKAYLRDLKDKYLFFAKEKPDQDTATLSGIPEELAALDRMEAQWAAAALDTPEAQSPDLSLI